MDDSGLAEPVKQPIGVLEPHVVLRADRFIVVDKPSGLLAVPGKGAANQWCVAAWARDRFPGATGPLIAHRLDMDTSGVMVLGLDEDAQRALSRQFEARTVGKWYVAVVEGLLGSDEGTITLPMRADIEHRPRQIVDHVHGREAETAWRVLARLDGRTRVELRPRTGRTHQLRVHLAAIGHPILGDVLYGDSASAPRLMLHAERLEFDEPGTGRRVEVAAAAPF
ncbi:MAG: RluA family pseudouridine synthase [Phycisphaerales bacterium]